MPNTSKHNKFCTIQFNIKSERVKALGFLIKSNIEFDVDSENVFGLDKKNCQKLEKKKINYIHI